MQLNPITKMKSVFSDLAGKGRAWATASPVIIAVTETILDTFEQARIMFEKVPSQALPWECDDASIQDWETHFKIKVDYNKTIDQRRKIIVDRYSQVGSLAADYMQYHLVLEGFEDAIIYQNLDGEDWSSDWGSTGIRMANGSLYWYNDDLTASQLKDPINEPTNEKQWRRVFKITVSLDRSNIDYFKELVLKYKPSGSICLVQNNNASIYFFDMALYNGSAPPILSLDASLVTLTNPSLYNLDGDLVIV